MCEEYESFHDRKGKPVVGGQSSSSFVPRVIKTDMPLDSDDLAHKDLLLLKYGERIEKLSQQDKLTKFCTDAGFLKDNVIIPDVFFKYNDHVGCAINLHSIINSGLIPGGQILSNRQTVFFLLVDAMDKNH